ncbi:MAG: hypothetical protein RIA64_01235 [Rhodospirillales bacterium]
MPDSSAPMTEYDLWLEQVLADIRRDMEKAKDPNDPANQMIARLRGVRAKPQGYCGGHPIDPDNFTSEKPLSPVADFHEQRHDDLEES